MRKIISLLLIIILLASCGQTASDFEYAKPEYLTKIATYHALYDTIYGDDVKGDFVSLSNQFYATFYPNNQENYNISVFPISGTDYLHEKLDYVKEQLKEEPQYQEFDRESNKVVDLSKNILSKLDELKKYYEENTYENDDYKGAQQLFKKIDEDFTKLDGVMIEWGRNFRELQNDHYEKKMVYYKEKGLEFPEKVILILMNADTVFDEIQKFKRDESYSINEMSVSSEKLNALAVRLDELIQKKQFAEIEWTERKAKGFNESLHLLAQTAQEIVTIIKETGKVDPTRIEQFAIDYYNLITDFNE